MGLWGLLHEPHPRLDILPILDCSKLRGFASKRFAFFFHPRFNIDFDVKLDEASQDPLSGDGRGYVLVKGFFKAPHFFFEECLLVFSDGIRVAPKKIELSRHFVFPVDGFQKW